MIWFSFGRVCKEIFFVYGGFFYIELREFGGGIRVDVGCYVRWF